jgi:hypothetical protein
MAASERNDRAEAKQLWTRLLAALPPGSDDARELKTRLAELGSPN